MNTNQRRRWRHALLAGIASLLIADAASAGEVKYQLEENIVRDFAEIEKQERTALFSWDAEELRLLSRRISSSLWEGRTR